MRREAALVFVVFAAACGGGGGSSALSADVVLEAAEGSGVEGTATVTRASPTSTKIGIAAELDGPGTAEIVAGECDGFAAPTIIRKLGPLTGGEGDFTVPLSFEEVTGTGYTLAVKRGAQYVTCGSIVP